MPVFRVTRRPGGHRDLVQVMEEPTRDQEIIELAATAGLDPDDAVVRWLVEQCTLAAGEAVTAEDLNADYRAWVSSCDEEPVTLTRFGRTLTRLGFQKDHKAEGGRTRRIGLRLRNS